MKIFATQAAIDAFGDPNIVEEYGEAQSHRLKPGQVSSFVFSDPAGNVITIDTHRYRDRVIVSLNGDPDTNALCLHCVRQDRIHHGTDPRHGMGKWRPRSSR
jgi:hypothetical protein